MVYVLGVLNSLPVKAKRIKAKRVSPTECRAVASPLPRVPKAPSSAECRVCAVALAVASVLGCFVSWRDMRWWFSRHCSVSLKNLSLALDL